MNSDVRIPEPGQIEPPVGQIRFLIPPGRNLFARRAARFRHLSSGHSLGDYLAFMALLADAQQEALSNFPAQYFPEANDQVLCRQHEMPLPMARSWARNSDWLEGFNVILMHMKDSGLPAAALDTIAGLKHINGNGLEKMADSILNGELDDVSPQKLPFVAAALQVYWVHMATTMEIAGSGRPDRVGTCPLCGSYPNVGIVDIGESTHGLRYLCCSLCASLWHMVRLKCSNCGSTRGINHYILEGSNGAVKAESCDECKTYLKLFYLEKERSMDATADDLASLALDMLMDVQGRSRTGPNLLHHPGRISESKPL